MKVMLWVVALGLIEWGFALLAGKCIALGDPDEEKS